MRLARRDNATGRMDKVAGRVRELVGRVTRRRSPKATWKVARLRGTGRTAKRRGEKGRAGGRVVKRRAERGRRR